MRGPLSLTDMFVKAHHIQDLMIDESTELGTFRALFLRVSVVRPPSLNKSSVKEGCTAVHPCSISSTSNEVRHTVDAWCGIRG